MIRYVGEEMSLSFIIKSRLFVGATYNVVGRWREFEKNLRSKHFDYEPERLFVIKYLTTTMNSIGTGAKIHAHYANQFVWCASVFNSFLHTER